MASLTISAGGGDPNVVIAVGGPSRCFFTLFVRASGSGQWQQILQSSNLSSSTSTFVLTPATLGAAAWTPGFKASFGWSGTFVGDMSDHDQDYAITIQVQQGGADIMTPFQDSGTFNTPSHSFVGSVNVEVV